MSRSRLRSCLIPARMAEFGRVAPVLVVVVAATAAWAVATDFDAWRRDAMQAADNAGLYLFISSPFLAALTAWAVTRATTAVGELADRATERDLIWRAAWPPLAVLAGALHAVVLAAMVVTARLSDAVGAIEPLPILVQFLSISFFAALGAFTGDRFRSKLCAPVLLLALLAMNTALASWGLRKITEVGTGSGDFIDLHLRLAYLLPKVAIFGAFSLFALPVRRIPLPLDAGRRYLAPAMAIAAAALVITGDQQPQAYAQGPRACHELAGITICEPEELSGHTALHDAAVVRVRHALERAGIDAVPPRVDYVSRGATSLPQHSVAVSVTAQALSSPRQAAREVELGFSYAMWCDDPAAELGPPDSVLRARALLDGWLQHQLDTVESGSYPADDWEALSAQPARAQSATVRRLAEEIWRCSPEVKDLP